MRELKIRVMTADNEWLFTHVLDLLTDYYDCELKEETLSQYTGLRDKNGVEIYEGGIVRHRFSSDGEVVEDIRRDCYVTNSVLYDGVTGYANTAEVIGNIYETPELLGEK